MSQQWRVRCPGCGGRGDCAECEGDGIFRDLLRENVPMSEWPYDRLMAEMPPSAFPNYRGAVGDVSSTAAGTVFPWLPCSNTSTGWTDWEIER